MLFGYPLLPAVRTSCTNGPLRLTYLLASWASSSKNIVISLSLGSMLLVSSKLCQSDCHNVSMTASHIPVEGDRRGDATLSFMEVVGGRLVGSSHGGYDKSTWLVTWVQH